MKRVAIAVMISSLVLFFAACAHNSANWDRSVGKMTYSDAVEKFGQPDKVETLDNGDTIARWRYTPPEAFNNSDLSSTFRPTVNRYDPTSDYSQHQIILTFGPKKLLKSWSGNPFEFPPNKY